MLYAQPRLCAEAQAVLMPHTPRPRGKLMVYCLFVTYQALVRGQKHRHAGIDFADSEGHEHVEGRTE